MGLSLVGYAMWVVAATHHLLRPEHGAQINNVVFSLLGPVMAGCGLAAIKRTSGRQRQAWIAFVAPVLLTFVAYSIDPDPYDPLSFSAYTTPLVSMGLLVCSVLLRADSWHRRTVERAVVDGLWVASALFSLWWTLGISEIIATTETGVGIQISRGVTALIALIAASDGIVSIPRVDRADRPTLALLAVSAVGTGATSLLQMHAGARGWDLAYIGTDLAWHASALPAVLATAQPWTRGERAPLTSLPTRSYLAVTAGPMVLAAPFAFSPGFEHVAAWWALALVAVFGTRTLTLLRENTALTNQLHHDSYHDQLTGFGNRRMLEQRLAQGGEATVVYLDLDGFKAVNDTHGHQTGDALLIAVGERLRTAVRDNDLVIRLGGDEFAVLLDADPNIAQRVAQRLVELICTPFDIDGTKIQIGTSVGIATGHLTQHGDILQHADHAMYRAKKAGGHRIEMAGTG